MSQWINQNELKLNTMKVFNNQNVENQIYKKTDTVVGETNTFLANSILNVSVINENTTIDYNAPRSTSNYLWNKDFNFIKHYTSSKILVDIYLNIRGLNAPAPMSMRCIIYNVDNVEQASQNILFYAPYYTSSGSEISGHSQMTNIKFYFENLAANQYKLRLVPWRTDVQNMRFTINNAGDPYVILGTTPYSVITIYELQSGITENR